MTLTDWQQKGKFFEYKGHQIFYLDEGKEEVLVCIHGFPTCSWDWHFMWSQLTSKYRVIAPDMIGFGFSDKPRDYKYSIFDQADLHEQLLKRLNIHSFHILAHDYGDTVAQELLARHHENMISGTDYFLIKSVCFLNGGIFSESYRPLFIQKVLMSPIGGLIGRLQNRFTFERNFKKIFGPNTKPTQAELDEWYSLLTYNRGKRIIHKVIRYMHERAVHRDRWTKAVQQTEMPLRLINGPEDPISGINLANRYKTLIENADVVLLDGIGHYPQTESPATVLEEFEVFHKKIEQK